MIQRVNEENLMAAAEVHATSWRASHREICAPDFAALHTAERQRDYLASVMAGGAELYLLTVEDRPVGVVSVRENVIGDLYVLPGEQGRGYGTELLRYAMDRCVGHPTLWVLSSNHRALRWYEELGFRPTGQVRPLSDALSEIEYQATQGR